MKASMSTSRIQTRRMAPSSTPRGRALGRRGSSRHRRCSGSEIGQDFRRGNGRPRSRKTVAAGPRSMILVPGWDRSTGLREETWLAYKSVFPSARVSKPMKPMDFEAIEVDPRGHDASGRAIAIRAGARTAGSRFHPALSFLESTPIIKPGGGFGSVPARSRIGTRRNRTVVAVSRPSNVR